MTFYKFYSHKLPNTLKILQFNSRNMTMPFFTQKNPFCPLCTKEYNPNSILVTSEWFGFTFYFGNK